MPWLTSARPASTSLARSARVVSAWRLVPWKLWMINFVRPPSTAGEDPQPPAVVATLLNVAPDGFAPLRQQLPKWDGPRQEERLNYQVKTLERCESGRIGLTANELTG